MTPVLLLQEQERQAVAAGQYERAALLRETADALQSMEGMAVAHEQELNATNVRCEKALASAWNRGYAVGFLEATSKVEHED